MGEKLDLRDKILEYVRSYFARTKAVPSIREIVRKFAPSINKGNVYQFFPSGLKQICQEANVPLPERVSLTRKAIDAKIVRKDQPRNDDLESQAYLKELYGLQRVLGAESIGEALKTARKICIRLSPYAEHYQVKDPLKALDIIEADRDGRLKEWADYAGAQEKRANNAETRAENAEAELRSLYEGEPEQRMLMAGVPEVVIAFHGFCKEEYERTPKDLPSFLQKTIINHAGEHGIRIAEMFDPETNKKVYVFTRRPELFGLKNEG